MKNGKTRNLVECAIMIALATILSFVKIWHMPLGGSITLLSMLPITIISVKHGLKWGFASSILYSVVQLALDLPGIMSWGITPATWIGCITFDYILAYGSLGIAGIFRKKGSRGMCAGIILALFLRYIGSVISGTIFFANWSEGWNPLTWAICYNGAFMLPEIIFTTIAAIIISKLPHMKKLVQSN